MQIYKDLFTFRMTYFVSHNVVSNDNYIFDYLTDIVTHKVYSYNNRATIYRVSVPLKPMFMEMWSQKIPTFHIIERKQ